MSDLLISFEDFNNITTPYNKMEVLEKNIEELSKRISVLEQNNQEIREEQFKSKKRIIDIYKYYKSTTTFGTISLNNALDMIYKRFFNYTFTEQDSQKNIIHLDYEELPERVALREREKNIFG
jgi:hypothetical protein